VNSSDWAGYLHFRDKFREATDPAFYPTEWLDDQIRRGFAQPIVGENAALVVEVRVYPGGARAAHGLIAAGDVGEIVGVLIPAAEQWGRDNGCTIGLIESREGWSKVLKSHGWNPHQVSLRKEL